jgi:hypothetical protein
MPGKQETDLAWAAGVLDSDGHIGVHWQKPNPKRREINGRWRLSVQVTGTILVIPERMKELFGGSVHYRLTTAGKQCAYWTTSQANAEAVLREVLPYLVGKRDIADKILQEREAA